MLATCKHQLEAYFRSVNARDVEALVARYAEDGCICFANRDLVCGREAIRAFFTTLFRDAPPAPRLVNVVGTGAECLAELRVTLADGAEVDVADIFRFDSDGLIRELKIFS